MSRACLIILLCIGIISSTPCCADAVFDIGKGWLCAGQNGKGILTESPSPPVDVLIDDIWLLQTHSTPPSVDHQQDSSTAIRYSVDSIGMVEQTFRPHPSLNPDAWLRELKYTNLSSETQDLTQAVFRLGRAASPQLHTWFPTHAVLFETDSDFSVGTAFKTQSDFYTFIPGDTLIEVQVDACWRLQPGQSATIGQQGIWLFKGRKNDFHNQLQAWYRSIGCSISTDNPAWLKEAILYETCAGGHVEALFSDVGGFDPLSKQLEYLADLGITLFWFNAVHEHKTPPNAGSGGWNHYGVLDHTRIDSILGGEERFRHLIEKTRQLGLHPLGEIVLWGGASKQGKQLEEWHIRDRNDQLLNPWGGGCVLDYSSPSWQKVIHDSVRLVAECGIQGLRIDVMDGHGPNWSSPRTNHASYSTLGGSLEMLENIRESSRTSSSEPILIPESLYDRPEYLYHGITLGYGMQTTFFFVNSIHPGEEPESLCSDLYRFFENEQGSLPDGSLVLRSLNNHDTVVAEGRTIQRFGTGLSRTLYGACLCVPGIPMLYQEDEVGSFEFLKQVHSARRQILPFSHGDVDYKGLGYSPKVFSVVRQYNGKTAVGLANVSGDAISSEAILTTAGEGLKYAQAVDRVSGATASIRNGTFHWTLLPYQVALIEIVKDAPTSGEHNTAAPPFIPPSSQEDISLQADSGGIRIQAGNLTAALSAGPGNWSYEEQSAGKGILSSTQGRIELVQKDGAVRVDALFFDPSGRKTFDIKIPATNRWALSGQTAWLADHTLQRHHPFPKETNYYWDRSMFTGKAPWGGLYNRVLPDDRLWQSVLEPLHSWQPGFVFTGMDSSLAITDVTSTAENIILKVADNPLQPERPDLIISFLGQDLDLSPRVRAFGLGDQWTMDRYPQPEARPLRVELVVSPAGSDVIHNLEKALRSGLKDRRPAVRRSGGRFGSDSFNAAWLIDPGTMTWTNLSPVDGLCRLALELRHSEVSAEGTDLDNAYEVTVNGTRQPLSWIQRDSSHTGNAYFGIVETPPLDLKRGSNTVMIRTLQSWCSIRGSLRLIPAE